MDDLDDLFNPVFDQSECDQCGEPLSDDRLSPNGDSNEALCKSCEEEYTGRLRVEHR